MPPLVRLVGASFGYEGRAVVAGVDLTIDAGRTLGIVGPNGSGKTTLFRGILGLVPPIAGRVERHGAVFGYVPQREALDSIFPLTAEEVVEMGAFRRLSRVGILSRADRAACLEVLDRVGLADRRRSPFGALSGGQRQRVLLARALLAQPNVLLLDEPTSGVDRGAQERILELLREVRAEGLAVLLVSHQLSLVRESVEEVLFVLQGKVELGSPAELLRPERLERLFGTTEAEG